MELRGGSECHISSSQAEEVLANPRGASECGIPASLEEVLANPRGASECRIPASLEEVLANLRGELKCNGHFSLDGTALGSQNLLNYSSPASGVQQNSVNLNYTRPPLSYGDDYSGSESDSEFVDGEADMAFTQEPVKRISPSSSAQASVGNDEVAKEDSYVAAFETDRSQSLSQDWPRQIIEQPNPQVETPNFGVSTEFLTYQPAVGVIDFQFASSGELCLQPFTRLPAIETQPLEPLNRSIQEPANQMQLAEGRNEIVHNPTLLDKGRDGTEESQLMQQGSGGDESVKDAPGAVNNYNGRTGEQTTQERVGDELFFYSPLPIDDGSWLLRSTEHEQQEHESHEIPRDIPPVEEVHRGDLGLSEKAQPLTQISEVVEFGTGRTPSSNGERMQRGNGDTESRVSKALKRELDCAEELPGQQKRQRVEASSPLRARSFPKTVMDVIRSRSRSLSHSLVDDECNILSILMRAGVKMSLQAKIPSQVEEN